MESANRIIEKAAVGAVGALATVLAARALESGWKLATGETPPRVDDPGSPIRRVIAWTVISALATALIQLIATRWTFRHLGPGSDQPAQSTQ